MLVLVLLRFEGEERSLNAVQEIASDPELLATAADKLREMGGIPARLGNQLKSLFDKEQAGTLSKEGAGVFSTVARHLAFLDSELVARSVAGSTFDPRVLLKPGMTLFLQIPPDQLEAQKGLLRCWISTLVRTDRRRRRRAGRPRFCSCSTRRRPSARSPPWKKRLVRGRSAGVRLLLAYQSDSQVRAAFKDKPTSAVRQLHEPDLPGCEQHRNAPSGYPKVCGDWTQVLEGYGAKRLPLVERGGRRPRQGQQRSQGGSFNYSVTGRSLLRPEEVLTLSDDYLIAFQRGLPAPILARRIRWFRDAAFNPAVGRCASAACLGLLAVAVALMVWAVTRR